MKKKKILTLSGIVLGIAMCFSFNKVHAIESVFSESEITRDSIQSVAQANTLSESSSIVPIELMITESGYQTLDGEIYWSIKDIGNQYKDLYCINLSRGFGAPNGIVADNSSKEYKNQYDFENLTTEQKEYLGITDENVIKKLNWILKNMATSDTDLTEILTKASEKVDISSIGVSNVEIENFIKNDMKSNNLESTKLTFNDIKTIQQVAIWHYTNPSNVFEGTLQAICSSDGNQISALQQENIDIDGYGTTIRNGLVKQAKINAIYKYLTDGADNATDVIDTVPTLSINNSIAEVKESEDGNYFIVGPYLLTGTNTEEIKAISFQTTINGGVFVNKNGEEILNIKSYIGNTEGLYFRISKENMQEEEVINSNIVLTYYYNHRDITLLTDAEDFENTQPIVTVEDSDATVKNNSLNITVNFELIKITVDKEWDDEENQDGKRPESVKVQLYENGQPKGDSIELSDLNAWTYTWKKLLKGNAYTVRELNSENNIVENNQKYNDDYTTTYSVDEESDKILITNTHEPEEVSKTVTKIWNDSSNQDGKRPESIQVQLLANGQAKGNKVTILDNNGEWSYTWNNLPKYENGGQEIEYTVVEDTIDGYVTSYSEDTFTITNSYTPGKVSKTVIKTWEDENNLEGIQPNEVTVTLYKNIDGQEIEINSQKLSKDNNWRYTWENLDEKQNGVDVVYLVKETAVDGYTTSYSEENYSNTNTITVTNKHVPVISGNYNVILKKVDNNGNELSGATISINGKNYTVGSAQIVSGEEIKSEDSIILSYEIEEITAPEDYCGLTEKKNIKIKLEIEKVDLKYNVKRAYLIDDEGNQTTDAQINVSSDINTNTITLNVVNNPIPKVPDLALRKFITTVISQDGKATSYNREPVVDTSTIATTGTATYKHTKEPVAVEVGDIVTYTIRVYNEGEKDSYVSVIKDHLPEWLDFLPDDELNQKYLWQQDINNNRIITTSIAAKDSANGENIYSNRENKQLLSAYNGGESLDYIDVEIRCKVNEKVVEGLLITNIADIAGMQDKEGVEFVTDRDSTKDNIVIPDDVTLPEYKGHEENKQDLTDKDYYYKGQEDDDDFEKLIVKKFDLSLRKFIIAVNGTELKSDVIEGNVYTREPKVDTSKLGTLDENGNLITTATYNHPKTPVEVEKGDIVTYILRVYNEGSLAGYANEIIENIPEGLEFIADSQINKQYGWTVREDGKLVTSYLADKKLNSVVYTGMELEDGTMSGAILDYKDVQVELKVVANASEFTGEIITNWAEINVESNKDIDSTPGNDVKTEDDIDYEPVKLVYFDLALRKFITNVDGTEYNNRIPEVDTSKMGTIDEVTGEKITTAKYTHTKDPVVLETGSTVIYTIRIYNEGTIAGYANEIVDNLPEGLEFLPENQTNIDYKWTMIDEEGNITQDVSHAKKIITNYLSENNDSTKVIDGYKNENGTITLSYQDVKVAFKVIEPNTSNRIVINTAEISKASMEDIDSIPGNNEVGEDDIDNEYVRVETFDLALEKWVKATKVTYKGKTKTTKTGFTAESTEMAKVDLVASQLSKTTVKFVYCIRVINEGQVAGYATEIKDYVPSGLKFVAKDNPNWVYDEKDDSVTTTQLKDKLLEPGQSETIEIVLTWKNSTTNLGVKTNWAEISADSGEDIDSTPDNNNKIEDDIDDAKVILSIKTGGTKMYIALIVASILILGGGAYLIKKKVLA